MTRRSFAIQSRAKENAAGGILDVPDLAILRYGSIDDVIANFKKQWGASPQAVMLPVTNADGLLFGVEGLGESRSRYSNGFAGKLKDFQDVVHAFADRGCDIYLSIVPGLGFIKASSLHIVDIVGDSSRKVCFGNPRSQEVIAAILGTGVDIVLETTKETKGKLRGVVIDVVNLWPMSGEKERMELTCFCPSCERFIDTANPALMRSFRTFPNPWSLLLKATSTGIEHINTIRLNDGPDDIVGMSRQKGFHKVFGNESVPFLREQAARVLEYVQVRHNQVLFAAQEVFSQALQGLDNPPRRILLTEGLYYSWTAGLMLEQMDSPKDNSNVVPFDEVWFDPQSTDLYMTNVDFRSYMASRGRYFIDHFFQFAAMVADEDRLAGVSAGHLPQSHLRNVLRSRLAQALSSSMSGQTSLSALPGSKANEGESRRLGFVGVALNKEIGAQFIEGIQFAQVLANERPENSRTEVDMGELLQRFLGGQETEDSD